MVSHSSITIFDRLAPITCPLALNAVRQLIELKRRALLSHRRSQSPADSATRVCGMNINTYINIAICCEKKLSSLPPSTDSSLQFWRNLRALGGAQSSSVFIFLHFRNLSLLNNHFLDNLSSSSYSSFLFIFFPPLTFFDFQLCSNHSQ